MVSHAGLVPYTVMVHPKDGGNPYQSTRWRHPANSGEAPQGLHVVVAQQYQGDLYEVFESWRKFAASQEDNDDLILPVILLQGVVLNGDLAVLVLWDNRVAGVGIPAPGDDIITAAPFDIARGITTTIEDLLKMGIDAINHQ